MTSENPPPRITVPSVQLSSDGSVSVSVSLDFGTPLPASPLMPPRRVATLSASLDLALRKTPPTRLWHYTSSDGLISILRSREIWASNISFLNDTKEIEHAVDYAKNAIRNRINRGNITPDEIAFLESLENASGTAARRYYVASFSEDQDLLSQWRAYCPPGGGYSLGLPSEQLMAVAEDQDFLLAPCIYDHQMQYKILSEITESFLGIYREKLQAKCDAERLKADLSWSYAQHVTRFGPTLKHPTFKEEREWRLISPMVQEPHPQLDFRGSATRIIPFFRFKLVTQEHPDFVRLGPGQIMTIIGPTSDRRASSMAVQFLMTSQFGVASFGGSEIPYRAW